ncbi:MAG: hypothetical protein IPQ07_23035 [Myxococcales bacterium]|nr:hypothetical protein [Myxococcales bacterium]
MNGFAHLLLETYTGKFDAEGEDWLKEIIANAVKMGSLIDALLSLAQLNRTALRRESVDLSMLAHAAEGRLEASDPRRAVEWVIEDGLHAEADPTLARALVDNLVGNAWKFTSKEAAPRIEVGATEHHGTNTFYVRDNGVGFDMTYVNKLFTPFQRLHSVREFEGTGIGLATVQRIVRRHGGHVWANGVVGGGATISFTLPDAPQEPAE